MKFFDRYKISLHNIKNNKSRSILTTIIVYIISLLMIFILSLAISFSTNVDNIIEKYYKESGEVVTINYYKDYESDFRVDNSNYQELKEIIDDNEEFVSFSKFYMNTYSSNMYFQNHSFPVTDCIEIIEGRNVSKEDVGTNKILVSIDYVTNYYETHNEILKPRDTVSYYESFYDEYGTTNVSLDLEIVGIYKINEEANKGEYSNYISSSVDFIVDTEYYLSQSNKVYIQQMELYYDVTKTNFNKKELEESLNAFVKQLEDKLETSNSNYSPVYCNALSDLKSSKITSIVIIGLAAFLCIVLILLSIGSLANTIMISVEKNKKFIGLLKALGLNEKDLKSTIKMESITTIVLGVLLSFLTVFACKELMLNLMTTMINGMFSYYLIKINYTIAFTLPFYIPVIVIMFFILFTLLFSKGSMSKIAKTDPMAVISEVA